MKTLLLASVTLLLPFSILSADPVGQIHVCEQTGSPLWGLQHYAVNVHVSQGSAPDGNQTVTLANGQPTFINCTAGDCGPDFGIVPEQLGPDPGQTVTHYVTINGIQYSASATGVILCYPEGTSVAGGCEVGACGVSITIQAYAMPPLQNNKCIDARLAGNQKTCSSCNSGGDSPAMATYSVHSLLTSLNIQDTPLRYSPPHGQTINFTATYNQKESQQPTYLYLFESRPKVDI